jgi:hypothetical protein
MGSGNQRTGGVAHHAEDGTKGGLGLQRPANSRQKTTGQQKPPGNGAAKAGRGTKAAHGFTFQEEFTEETIFLRFFYLFRVQMQRLE